MPEEEHANADVFSHLPLPVQQREVLMSQELVCLLESIELSTVKIKQIKGGTNRDPVLSQVCKFMLEGWPNSTDPEFHPYHTRKLELQLFTLG